MLSFSNEVDPFNFFCCAYNMYFPIASCFAHTFPFSAPCNDMLAMLVYANRWLSLHLYTLAYMSMHEFYFLVCRPCFNTMKLWTSDPNLHLSLMDTTFFLFPFLFVVSFLAFVTCYMWGQRIWVPRPISNNKPKGPAEEENIRGWLRKAQSY